MTTEETVPSDHSLPASAGFAPQRGPLRVISAASGPARIFYGLGLAMLIGVLAYIGRGVLIPVIVAGFVSFLIFTLKETIKNGPLVGRFLPDWLCYTFAFALMISAGTVFIEIIKSNVETLVAAAPEYEARLRKLTQDGIHFIEEFDLLPADLIGGMDELRSSALSLINPVLSEVASSIRTLTGNLVTVFLYTIFMLFERGRIFAKINLLNTEEKTRAAVSETISEIASMVREFITLKTVINLITASVSYLILILVGVDFAGFWALLIFLLNYVPIIGPIAANAFPVILALVQPDGGLQKAGLALALLVGAEQTMSTLVEPRLVGKSLNLSPLIILFSLAVWGSLWGFAGLLLAVPITVTTMIILTQFKTTRPIAILLSADGQIAPIRHATQEGA